MNSLESLRSESRSSDLFRSLKAIHSLCYVRSLPFYIVQRHKRRLARYICA